jgi:hypothetical protein
MNALKSRLSYLIDGLDNFFIARRFAWARVDHGWRNDVDWLVSIEDKELNNKYKEKLKKLYLKARNREKSIIKLHDIITIGPPDDIMSWPAFTRVCVKKIGSAEDIATLNKIIEELKSCDLEWFKVQDNTDKECQNCLIYRSKERVSCGNPNISRALCEQLDKFLAIELAKCRTKDDFIKAVANCPEVWFYKNGVRRKATIIQTQSFKTKD